MMKIFLATPAFEGKVNIQYAIGIADTCLYLASKNIPVQLHITMSGSLLVAERNRIIKAFMQSDCTHILCVDSDIGWHPYSVEQMINHNVDMVAACYPARGLNKTFLFRPVYLENKALCTNEQKTLLKMNFIPAGFMLIKKEVIEEMQKKFPELYFEPKNPEMKHESAFAFFNTEIWDGEFWGEDFVFCKRVRDAGFDIWVDPLIELDHAGVKGKLIDALSSNPDQHVPVEVSQTSIIP